VNKSDHLKLALSFSLVVSAFGFVTILALAAQSTGPTESVALRKPVVGSIFALICILGVVLALSPRKCSETFGDQNRLKAATSSLHASNSGFGTKGHHYACGKFSAHTIQVNGRVICAACTGLSLGALGALFGTAIYFFAEREYGQIGFFAVVLGVVAMVLGFLQLKSEGFVRMLLNMLFVLGAFLILAGMDGLKGSLLVDLFSIVLTAFWIFTRILLSQWDHWKTCRRCSISCKIRNKKEWGGSIPSAQSVEGADYDQCSKDNYGKRPDINVPCDHSSLLQEPYYSPEQYDYAYS
jgi:hypothetical protein